MGRFDPPRIPCPYDYPDNCMCNTCVDDRRVAGLPSVSTYEKYSASYDSDTGTMQTNFFSDTVGERDQKKKVHVAIDEYGNVVYVRDIDGKVLYDKKHGIGYLPFDLNWSYY